MSTVTISRAQRDALYDALLDHLSGLGDLQTLLDAEHYDDATRLAQEFSDDLRFIADDLSFGPAPASEIRLRTPPEVLARLLPRLERQAADAERADEEDRRSAVRAQAQNRAIREACQSVLGELGS
jgi:hypothetical protein